MAEINKKAFLPSSVSTIGSTARKRNQDVRRGQVTFVSPMTATGSPSFRTPTGGLGMSDVSEVPLNDDEAERRQRRRDNHMRSVMSPGCHTPRSAVRNPERVVESGTSSFSNTQIAEHYSTCIKLSAANKINSKNAFGLHLIDWMTEVLRKRGEMTNFQVAGCTLDASAKIYAGRVDSIYNDAFKVLGGFGRSDNQDKDDDIDENNDGAQRPPGGKRKGRKTNASSAQTIEKDSKSLDVNTYDMEFEVDPLFKKISTAIDEESVEGMLLNNIYLDSDRCSLLLDSAKLLSVKDSDSNMRSQSIPDGSELQAFLLSIKNFQSLKICPTFAHFKFNENSENSDTWNLQSILSSPMNPNTSNDYCPRPDAEYSMIQQQNATVMSMGVSSSPPPSGYDNEDDNNDDDIGMTDEQAPCHDVACDPQAHPVSGNETVLGTCGDGRVISGIVPSHSDANMNNMNNMNKTELQNLISGELCLSDTIQLSEYSYFNPTVLSTWAGPQHWKLRPRNKDIKDRTNNDNDNAVTAKKKRQPRQVFRVDFTLTPDESLFKKGRAATQLSKAALAKLSSIHTTLPHDTHTDVTILYQLFSRPKWKVKRRKQLVSDVMEEPLEGEFYNYDNANDSTGYLPVTEEAPEDDMDDPDGAQMSGVQFMSMLNETETQIPFSQDLTGNNLIAEPKKVTPIEIEYAKQAKRVDVKKLKATMWKIITKQNNQEPPLSSSSSDSSNLSFSSLYSGVMSQLSTSMATEMSVPISFVCLLHLANEKILNITAQDDMSNFVIGLSSKSPRD